MLSKGFNNPDEKLELAVHAVLVGATDLFTIGT